MLAMSLLKDILCALNNGDAGSKAKCNISKLLILTNKSGHLFYYQSIVFPGDKTHAPLFYIHIVFL